MNLIQVPIDEQWWRAQRPEIRVFRGYAMVNITVTQQFVNFLLSSGKITPEQYDTYRWIVGWGWTPTEVYRDINGLGLDAISAMTTAPDLILAAKPFGLSNRPGDGGIRGAIGTTYNLLDTDGGTMVGSEFKDDSGSYLKVLGVAQASPPYTYYADWSLSGMTPMWLKTAEPAS